MWILIYNMLFIYIMTFLSCQAIDLSSSRSKKSYQYCYTHCGSAEILHSSVFWDFTFFMFYFVWSFYVFDFKGDRWSTVSWSTVSLLVHSYTDFQGPFQFSFAVAFSPKILSAVSCIVLILSILGIVVFPCPFTLYTG